MEGSPPMQGKRQRAFAALQNSPSGDVEKLRALSHGDLALLRLILARGPASEAALSSALMIKPSQVRESLRSLEAKGFVVLSSSSETVAQASELSRKLKRVIAAIE